MNEIIPTNKYKTIKEHGIEAPLALLAELSHRCPLQCPYCSFGIFHRRNFGNKDALIDCQVCACEQYVQSSCII